MPLRAAVLLLVLSFLMTPALAITRYVDAARPDNSGDGLSWTTAHKYLQTALAAAQSGDQIWVAQGIYKPTTSTTDRGDYFVMKENVKIYGGFTSGQMNLTDRDTNPLTNSTVLSGDIDSDNTLAGNSYHLIVNNYNFLTAEAVLDGFTITGGNANGSNVDNYGGGIFCSQSSPAIIRCVFRGDAASTGTGYGGAIALQGNSSAVIVNCLFEANKALRGGAVSCESSTPNFINCSFLSNTSTNYGGALFMDSKSSSYLTNCSFTKNRATEDGEAIYLRNFVNLVNCVLYGNGDPNEGSNTIYNAVYNDRRGTTLADYCLFDAEVNGYTGSNNLTTTINPFVSSTSTVLRPCSPAIDAGSNAAYDGPATDLANNPRTVRTIDMGAYEFQSALPVIVATLSGNPLLTPSESDGLRVSISDGTAPYTIVYSDGSTNYTVSNYQSGDNIPVYPAQPTTYTLVSVTDANGCVGTASGSVTVQDARCGNKNQNVTICYYGVTQCVSEKIAQRYLKLGATLGGCGTGNARIGAEETSAPLQLALKAYPNPMQDAVTLEVLTPSAGEATFEVVDLTGRTRQSRNEVLVEGLNEVGLRLGSLPAGLYLIRATDARNRQGVVKVSKE